MTVVARYQPTLLRPAQSIISNHAVAQEAVQDTWMGVVRGVERFQGRSSFKTWLFAILANRARSAGFREHPETPIEALHTIDPLRFDPEGNWADPLEGWTDNSDERLGAGAWLPAIKSALQDLPPRQRQVVLLRDVEGLSHAEARGVLGISVGNQLILLHRGWARLREILEGEMEKN